MNNNTGEDTPLKKAAEVSSSSFSDYRDILKRCFDQAEELVRNDSAFQRTLNNIGPILAPKVQKLAQTRHAARGALLTLALYKSYRPDQDIRNNKMDHSHGFPARTFDTVVTVPFLQEQSLPRNVETHWLSQTLSFGGRWDRSKDLITQPRHAGTLLIEIVNDVEELFEAERKLPTSQQHPNVASDIVTVILGRVLS